MDRDRQRIVRRTALGSEAVYRVIAEDRVLVELEVVSAPGLEAGARLRVTKAAVEAMEQLKQAPASVMPQRPVRLSSAPESG